MRLGDPKKYQGKKENGFTGDFLHLGMGKGRMVYFPAALFITPLSSLFGKAGHSRGQKGSSPPFLCTTTGHSRLRKEESENSCVYVCTVQYAKTPLPGNRIEKMQLPEFTVQKKGGK